MGVSLSPAAMAQAAEDTAAYRNQVSPDLLNSMTPNQSQALASSPQARQVAHAVTHEIGPFGKPIPAEVLRRSDTLYSNVTIPSDGVAAIPNVVPFWVAVTPDGITQSQEVVQSRITAQVDFEIRSVSIQCRMNLGDENLDFLMRSGIFEINSVDQNVFRRQLASGIIRDHAKFATALAGFAAPGTEVTLVTGVDARGVDLDPTQYILWERDQTLNMLMRFVPGAVLPVSLGVASVTDLILTLWGRKQTKMKG